MKKLKIRFLETYLERTCHGSDVKAVPDFQPEDQIRGKSYSHPSNDEFEYHKGTEIEVLPVEMCEPQGLSGRDLTNAREICNLPLSRFKIIE